MVDANRLEPLTHCTPSMGSVTVPITQTTAGRAAASTARTGNA